MIEIPKFDSDGSICVEVPMDKLSNGSISTDVKTTIRLSYCDEFLRVHFENDGDFNQTNHFSENNSAMYNQTVVEMFIASVASLSSLSQVPTQYIEIEVTPSGALYLDRITNLDGTGKNNQHDLQDCSLVKVDIPKSQDLSHGRWQAALLIHFGLIGGKPVRGQLYRANFFRVQMNPGITSHCTPDTCQYLAWKPTLVHPPQFHIPKYLGEFVLT